MLKKVFIQNLHQTKILLYFQVGMHASWKDKLNLLDKFDDDRLVGFGKKIILSRGT